MKRPHQFKLLLTPDERKQLALLAEKRNLTASDYVRQLIRRESETARENDLIQKLRRKAARS